MNLRNRFIEVNEGYEAFAAELKHMNLWANVTTIQVSDFARTLNPNSGDGTDHAWGGNYMMMGKCACAAFVYCFNILLLLMHLVVTDFYTGGSVKGGQILGDYPDNLTDDGPLTLSRGRMIPTKPW